MGCISLDIGEEDVLLGSLICGVGEMICSVGEVTCSVGEVVCGSR